MNPLDKNAPLTYLSVGEMKETELIIEKSRFLGFAFPVQTIEEIDSLLLSYHEKYRDANHVCYAYRLGASGIEMKASDDGEPSGTAGVPMLEVLKKENLTDTLVIVVRYFGGIKLGSGGLIRAYGKSAKEAVLASQILTYQKHYPLSATVEYTFSGGLSHLIKEKDWQLDKQIFTDKVTYLLEVPEDGINEVEATIVNFTKNQVVFERGNLVYLPLRKD